MGHSPIFIGDKEVPSVTQVIGIVDKPFLRIWYGKLGLVKCEQIKTESAELGKRIHAYIEARVSVAPAVPVLFGREAQIGATFDEWYQQSGYKAVETERKVTSHAHGYGGTLDSIGHFGTPDALWIMDWKTTNQIDPLYGVQLSAYAQAYFEETGKRVVGGGIVRLAKDPTKSPQIEVKQFDSLEKYFDVFLACKQVWEFVNAKGQWQANKTTKRKKAA